MRTTLIVSVIAGFLATAASAQQNSAAPLPPDIASLAERLEQKFSMELDEILRILKGNLKANIVEELLSHLQRTDDSQGETDEGAGKK